MSKILNNVCHSVSAIHSPADYTSVILVVTAVSVSVNTNKSAGLLSRLAFEAVFERQIVAFVKETQIFF